MSPSSERLRREHLPEAIAQRLEAATGHNYLGDFVLGAVDGAVTTFAIVAGSAGAELSNGVVLVLGIANLLADGFSMAAGNFLRARSEHQVLDRFRRLEERHIDEVPEGEREEIRQIFHAKGFEGEALEQVTRVITEDRRRWVNTMLTEEWGLQLRPPSPWCAGGATFLAFLLAGAVPLLPTLILLKRDVAASFAASSLLTAVAFLGIGYVRGRVVDRRPLASAVETFLIGGAAAGVAFAVGKLLHQVAAY